MNDIPDRVIIRCQQNEIARKDAEIRRLQAKLESKERAITAFKKWQQSVCEYKYHYWLNQGVSMMNPAPDAEQLKTIINDFSLRTKLHKSLVKLISQCMNYNDIHNKLIRIYEKTRITENPQV